MSTYQESNKSEQIASDQVPAPVTATATQDQTSLHPLPVERYRSISRIIIATQCFGVISSALFSNGFMLSFFSRAGIRSTTVLLLLSVPSIMSFLLVIPAAFLSDRMGKKFIGTSGLWAAVIGFGLLIPAGAFTGVNALLISIVATVLFGAGLTIFGSSWFVLLYPIIPEQSRGRFFGQLRLSFQLVSVAFTFVVMILLKANPGALVYQLILAFAGILLVIRILFYRGIPELEKPVKRGVSFKVAFVNMLTIPDYLPFCSYIFLLTLSIGACPWVLNLLEQDVLHFSPSSLVWMGNILAIGSLIGFYFGGILVDRHGTKPAFLICHFSYGVILFAALFRGFIPLPAGVVLTVLTFLFGVSQAVSGIAITTQTFDLLPSGDKSLCTALASMLQSGAVSLSAILYGRVIDLKILSPEWTLMGHQMSSYDSLLAFSGFAVLMLVITLGLIPSVIRKQQWIP